MDVLSTRQVGPAVRCARLEAHLSQADLADKVGVTREWIGRLERGTAPGLEADKVFRTMFLLGFSVQAPDGTEVTADEESVGEAATTGTSSGSITGRRVSSSARRQLMAEMEKAQQLAGHQPSQEAVARAERLLDGVMTLDQARQEILARYKR